MKTKNTTNFIHKNETIIIKWLMFVLVIILGFLIYTNYSVKKKNNNAKYTIEMTYVDGYVETDDYILPIDSKFYVSANKGGYVFQTQNYVIKAGVIRYKIINKQK